MGVMLARFGAAALVLGAVYATFFRANSSPEEPDFDPRLQHLFELSSRQRRAMVLWSAHMVRDSALARVATMTVEPGEVGIIVSGFPRGTSSPEAAALIGKRWGSVGATDPSVRVAVLILNDAVFDSLQPQGYPYSGALLATSPTGGVCVAMSYGSLDPRGNIDIVESQLDRALAPCLLRAAFGNPGRGVRDWLNRTRFAAAKSNAWLYRRREFLDGRGQLPWEPIDDEALTSVRMSTLSSLLRNIAAFEITMMLSPPYVMGGPALRCLAGNETECSRTVLDSVPLTEDLPKELTASWGLNRQTRRNAILSPHPVGDWFLSDIIRWEGTERFARFWKSDAPFEAAFRDAFGQELGAWTRAWGTRQGLGNWEEQYSRKQVILGASLRPSWPLLVIGWTAAALLIAAWTAKRRQVTT